MPVLVLCCGLLASTIAATADEGTPQEEREQVRERRAAVASRIDALRATDEEVEQALAAVEQNVQAQETELQNAQGAVGAAADAAQRARTQQEAAIAAVVATEDNARILTVEAYVRPQNTEVDAFVMSGDSSEAVRRNAYMRLRASQLRDALDRLEAARVDVTLWRTAMDEALTEAEQRRGEVAMRLAEVEGARRQQQQVVDAVDDRIDAALAESDALAALDQQLAVEIARRQAALAARARSRSAPVPRSGSAGTRGAVAAPGDITSVRGIQVHASIAANVEALLAAAEADGVALSGGGYRNSAGQIAVRRANCGTSDYAIYQMPSSGCSPPTAPPGRSMHERGLAIDFTYGGSVIGSRSSPAFQWLQSNAGRFGLSNMPAEPWHWSTNGN